MCMWEFESRSLWVHLIYSWNSPKDNARETRKPFLIIYWIGLLRKQGYESSLEMCDSWFQVQLCNCSRWREGKKKEWVLVMVFPNKNKVDLSILWKNNMEMLPFLSSDPISKGPNFYLSISKLRCCILNVANYFIIIILLIGSYLKFNIN